MDWSKIVVDVLTFHRGKLIGATIGLVFGLFTILFGFWKAFFLGICIFVGYFLGRRIDENKDFKALIKKLWSDS
ncbi:DUF2273 domain-containing protein [Desulfitibacter alkalitolerans]|uniref:DUF2273 domain-containing protein n=1 Tax=Desulfitibacter alkalitolerans TaxID=264641 RepID=UPI0004880D42|nr:DUF2273 domain-containing protein [Desulfitibacter alkalitolerans]